VYDFLATRNIEHLKELEKIRLQKEQAGGQETSRNKIRYEKKKEDERAERKKKTAIERLEREIAALEESKHSLEMQMANPEVYVTDGSFSDELFRKYESIEKKISVLYLELEKLHS
jgi:ATP-binding cassette, subfamily F, member 3